MSDNTTQLLNIAGQTARFQKNLKAFPDREKNCDIELVSHIDGKRIRAHTAVIAAGSTHLDRLIKNQAIHSWEKMIHLHLDVSGDILSTLVNYFYTGSIEVCIRDIKDLFAAVQLLGICELKDACRQFIVENLNANNCYDLLRFAELKFYGELEKNIWSYMKANLEMLFENCNFLNWKYAHILSIVKAVGTNKSRRQKAFTVVERWVNHDKAAREQYIDELIDAVQLPLLSARFLLETVKPFCTTAKSLGVCCEAIKLNDGKFDENDELLLIFHRDSGENGLLYMNVYDPKFKTWTTLENTVPHRLYYGVTLFDSRVFLFGGTINGKVTDSVISMNLKTMKCKYEQPMLRKAQVTTVVAIKTKIYVFVIVGGEDWSERLQQIDCWDTVTDKWSQLPTETGYKLQCGADFQNKLLTLNTNDMGTTIKRYDAETASWSEVVVMKNLQLHKCYVLNGIMHLAGQQDYAYNLGTKTLTKKSENSNFTNDGPERVFRNKIVSCYYLSSMLEYNPPKKARTDSYYFSSYDAENIFDFLSLKRSELNECTFEDGFTAKFVYEK